MNAPGFFCLGMIAAGLAGCANREPPPPPMLTVSGTKACAADVGLAGATSLVFNAEKATAVDLVIGEYSSCLQTAGGAKSLYGVVALPEPGYEYILSVESEPQGSSIFAPRLVFLGGDGKMIREVERKRFMFRGGVLAALLRVHKGERYLVVQSDAQGVGAEESRILSSTQTSQSSFAGAGGTMFVTQVRTGAENIQNLTYSHGGKVKVVARPIPTAKN